MNIVNTHQAEAWNGYEGTHWADHRDRYDAVSSGFNEYVLRGIGEHDRVLDLGCGTGQLTRLAAGRATKGEAYGIDLSEPMLRQARAAAAGEGVANVRFEQADAQAHPFPEAAFDVAVSRFAIMFFADPVAAFANVRRSLRPGGRIAFLSLHDMAHSELGPVLAAMAEHLPPAGPGDGTSPVSLSDPAVIHDVFTEAGFTAVSAEPVEAMQVWGRDARDAADFLGAWGPVRFALAEADQAARSKVDAALEAALRPHEHDGAVRLRGAAWLITADVP